jgi:hypothetical protein
MVINNNLRPSGKYYVQTAVILKRLFFHKVYCYRILLKISNNYSINQLVFMMTTDSVFCKVGAE